MWRIVPPAVTCIRRPTGCSERHGARAPRSPRTPHCWALPAHLALAKPRQHRGTHGRPASMSYLGIAISLWPYASQRRYTLWDTASATKHAGLLGRGDTVPAFDHYRLHGVVVLGVSRQTAPRYWLPLKEDAARRHGMADLGQSTAA